MATETTTEDWRKVATTDAIDDDDVLGVEIDGARYALYNLDGNFYATDGICTHEYACLDDGLVIDGIIECPLHQGRFDVRSGKAKSAPVSVNLKTYPVKVEGTDVFIRIDAS